jgi:hypothetical protein
MRPEDGGIIVDGAPGFDPEGSVAHMGSSSFLIGFSKASIWPSCDRQLRSRPTGACSARA